MVTIKVIVKEVIPDDPNTFRRNVNGSCRDVKGFSVTAASLEEARKQARIVLAHNWTVRSISFSPVRYTTDVVLVATVKGKV